MSTRRIQRLLASVCPAALALVVTACSGGGGGGSPPPASPPPPGTVQISGKITYDFVPHSASGGLAYGQTQPRPARLVTVQFVPQSGATVTTRANLTGDYSLNVPANTTGMIRAQAQLSQTGTPGWTFSVVDNLNGDAIYTLDGAQISSGSTASTRNLHAASGWDASNLRYSGTRAAAPFAILDSIYTAAAYIVVADPNIVFPALDIHWSPNNISSFDADGNPDPTTGEIGTSFYAVLNAPGQPGLDGIYLLGEENQDSDEYDQHVVIHEFGHYLEHRFGRTENIGGPHSGGDRLDPRVAFSEGWPTALAGLAVADPVYADAGLRHQQSGFTFNMERELPLILQNPAPGWYSERSVWELVYDLVDTAVDGGETIAYPFSHVWTVLKGMRTSPALPTVFPLWNAIKLAHPGDVAQLNSLTAAQSISPVMGDYGAGETNNANRPHVLPIYTDITVNGPDVNLCSIDDFTTNPPPPLTPRAVNKLSSRRFLKFTSTQPNTSVTITVTATSIPSGEYADPDFGFHWGPIWLTSDDEPSPACKDNATGSGTPASCVETGTIPPVPIADFVLEVYEWTNTNDTDDEFPPIGDTCFNVRVQQP